MGAVIAVVVDTTAAPVEDGDSPAVVVMESAVVTTTGAVVDLRGQLLTPGPQEVIVTPSVWYTMSSFVDDALSVVEG